MRKIVTPIQIYPALQSLLGLPEHCLSFELSVRHDQIGVTVTCEHVVALDTAGLKQLESVFSQYDLVHRPAPAIEAAADSAEFHVVDFDAWMRARTERAHREFMERTARLDIAIPGTKVALNSGGPVMTVIGMTYDGKAVACKWSVDGLAMGDSFPVECLVRHGASQIE